MPVTTVYLIRHAETTWNAQRRLQGRLDAPHSERGARQSNACINVVEVDGMHPRVVLLNETAHLGSDA